MFSSLAICCDVSNLKFDTLENIDALAFGFPCNDFSIIGERHGLNGKYGLLYNYAVEALKIFQPDWFVAENVRGLLSANKGSAQRQILSNFRDAGYKIFPHLYKFEDYGVPQTRHRIIVVERLKYIKPGQNAFNADIPPELQLHVKAARFSNIYRRLAPDKPSYTVTGSGGGGTHIYHYVEPRALTNRERARLQTFPDDFIFYGSKENVRQQIGMAVPCAGAKIIFESILKTFAGIEYDSIPCNINFTE